MSSKKVEPTVAELLAAAQLLAELHAARTQSLQQRAVVPRQQLSRMPLVSVDKEELVGSAADRKSLYAVMCGVFTEESMITVVLNAARHGIEHRRTLASSISTDGTRVVVTFRDASKRARIAPGLDNEGTRRMERDLHDGRAADFLPGHIKSYKTHVISFAVEHKHFGDWSASDVWQAWPKKKPAPPKKGEPDHWGVGVTLWSKLVANPVDYYKLPHFSLAVWERAARCGVIGAGRTAESLHALLSRVHLSFDMGFVDFLFGVAGVFVPRDESKTVDDVLDAWLVGRNAPFDGAEVLTLLETQFDLFFKCTRWSGAVFRETKVEPSPEAARAAAELSDLALEGGGWKAADEGAFSRFSARAHEPQRFVPRVVDAAQRTLTGAPAAQLAARAHAVGVVAQLPLTAFQHLQHALPLAVARRSLLPPRDRLLTDQEMRDLMCVAIGKPSLSATCKGFAPIPTTKFVDELARHYHTLVLNEYNTSKCCRVCGAELDFTSDDSYRYKKCAVDGVSHNRDFMASVSMTQLKLTLLITGQRPAPWMFE